MNKKYVEEFTVLERTHWWFIIRQKIIMQALKRSVPLNKNTPLKILNIGAAGGASSKWLATFGNVVSVEYDLFFLEYLINQNIPVTQASITSLPFENGDFDLVCAFDVIEHVEDHHKAVQEMLRVCKPDGNICITVPAFNSLWGNHDEINGHYRRYTKKTFKEVILTQVPVKYIYSSYFNTILFIPLFLFRKINKLSSKKQNINNSDFANFTTHKFLNKLLKVIFGTEFFLLKWMRFPFGISLLTILKK